jgi:secretion/DNA translocation related TadE-like protein
VRRGEGGWAAPVVVALTGVLVTVTVVAAVLGRLLVEHRRAAVSADLAALAGAVALQHGQDACLAADESAENNDAELVGCVVEGERVQVEAALPARELWGRRIQVRATAHAGPR